MDSLIDLVSELHKNNDLQEWLIAAGAFGISLLVLFLFRKFTLSRLTKLAQRTTNTVDDTLVEAYAKTKMLFLIFVSFWVATFFLSIPEETSTIIDRLVLVTLLIQIAIWASSFVGRLIQHFVNLEIEDETSQIATAMALTFVAKLVLWTLVFLLALENLGYEVSALVTGLGVGGIAVALAAQNILGDLFASLSIMFDKPFVVGDFIIVGDLMGTVEKIGLKTTRIRSLHGEQLIFSNNDLLSSRIRNYKRMSERRILFTIGVTYQTPFVKVERIPAIIRQIIEDDEMTRFDRSHFKGFGDSALLFETVYWVLAPDYNTYMDIQQRINLELFRVFEEEGISFAYPTQTIHVEQAGKEGVKEKEEEEKATADV